MKNRLKRTRSETVLIFLCICFVYCFWGNANLRAEVKLVNSQISIQQQSKKIIGKVVDVNGEPLIGATVIEKSANNGVVTDMDGSFTINIENKNSILKVSYVGYLTQEVSLAKEQWHDSRRLTITMKEESGVLDEIVVVGYGTQKKVNLTGAVAQVKGETLNNRSVTNISQALQGQVGNLNISSENGGAPGSVQTINLRGYTGFGTSAAPLIVIDGVQGGSIDNINMNDVESVTVLKDAASAAIYGSNAPFGVILVTTKKGKKGQKPTITYENNFGFAQPINLPRLMNSLDVANFYNEASRNSERPAKVNAEQMERINDYMNGLISYETIVNPVQGSDSWLAGNANNDWFDIWFKDVAFNHRHSVGVSGSSEHSQYYVGLGYLDQQGIFKVGEDRYQRYNVRVNLSVDLAKWLTFGIRGNFVRGKQDTIDEDPGHVWQGSRMHAISRMLAFDPFNYPNKTQNDRYLSFNQAGKVTNIKDNAVLTGEITLHPIKGWEVTANYSLDVNNANQSYHQKTVYQTTPKGNVVPIYGTPNGFSRSFDKAQHYTINAFTSYEKQIGKHYFKFLAGFAQELYDNLNLSGSNNYLFSDNLPALSLAYGASPTVGDRASQLAIRGGFGRINYNYMEKYLIEFNGRYDASSRFLKEVRYKFYPGVSVAWLPSKESFWEPVSPYINSLKVRASYGQLGDQNVSGYYPFYPSLNTVQSTNSNYMFGEGRDIYVSQPSLVDPSLTWMTSSSLNLGVDLSFLSNRLNVSFDWYRREVADVVGPAEEKPAILGTNPPQINSASMKTEGFELSIGWRDRIGKVQYSIDAVLSDYHSTILKYPNPSNLNYTWYPGKNIGEIWGYETVGLFQSKEEVASAPKQTDIFSKWGPGDCRYADLNRDNKISWGNNTLDNPGDKKVIGNTTPRYAFGINLNAEYQGFDFGMFIQGIGKRNSVCDPDNNTATYFWGITGDENQSNGFEEQLDRWGDDNPQGYFPKFYWGAEMTKNKQIQTRYMQNAAYVRLKNLQLGYSLPQIWINKYAIQKIRVFATAENLFTLTKMIKTMDPEFSNTATYYSGPNGNYPDGKVYPLQRTFAFGINLTF